MRLSSLLGLQVVGESGWRYGKAFDVRVLRHDGESRVVGLVVGSRGFAERLFGERTGEKASAWPVIRWEDVVDVQGGTIVVRDDARPDQSEPAKETR